MVKWIKAVVVALGVAFCAAPVAAQSIEQQVVSQLRAQGFTDVEVSRTLLGRWRFVAFSDDRRREIVVHPTSGAVLFDDVSSRRGGDSPNVRIGNRSDDDDDDARDRGDDDDDRGTGRGDDDREDDDRDDDDDDDRDDDDDDDDDRDDDDDDDDD